MHAALTVVAATDMSYPTPFPSPSWMSPDISTPSTPRVGVPNTIRVSIHNYGPTNATDVKVHFGIHNFSASTTAFHDLGTKVVDVPSGATVQVEIAWTPQSGSHQCAKVEIGYGNDTNYGNNKAQRNLRVLNSPGYFEVANTLELAPATIDLVPFFEEDTGTCSGGPNDGPTSHTWELVAESGGAELFEFAIGHAATRLDDLHGQAGHRAVGIVHSIATASSFDGLRRQPGHLAECRVRRQAVLAAIRLAHGQRHNFALLRSEALTGTERAG